MKQILILPLLFFIAGCMLVSSKNINESAINKADSIDKIQSNIKQQPPHNIDLSKCDAHSTQLSIFTKNDFAFEDYGCYQNDTYVIAEYLKNDNNNIILPKYTRGSGTEFPTVKAVSIYRPNDKNKLPVLIILHGEDVCCYPRPSGTFYEIYLYQIKQTSNYNIHITDITGLLGKNASGFDGKNDFLEPVTFKFKDIATIKAWLKENY